MGRASGSGAVERAKRLRREAANCLAVAVRERDPHFAGTLIDEAIRLTRRSDELTAPC